jgi:hypothetical protein
VQLQEPLLREAGVTSEPDTAQAGGNPASTIRKGMSGTAPRREAVDRGAKARGFIEQSPALDA